MLICFVSDGPTTGFLKILYFRTRKICLLCCYAVLFGKLLKCAFLHFLLVASTLLTSLHQYQIIFLLCILYFI